MKTYDFLFLILIMSICISTVVFNKTIIDNKPLPMRANFIECNLLQNFTALEKSKGESISNIENFTNQNDFNICNISNKNVFVSNFDATIPEKIRITLNSVNIYENADLNSEIISKAYFKEVYTVISIEENFYKIDYYDSAGYILMAYAMDASIEPLVIELDTNAGLTKESNVYDLIDNQYELVENIKLDAEFRIKVLSGFDLNKPYCKASFQIEEETFTYYIPTENIVMDGINMRTVIAITLIIVCVTIFLILYGFFRGKKSQSIKYEFNE